ncbi:MAG: galactose-1-phosphate uridylyltransferase [Myxococcota bacterium]
MDPHAQEQHSQFRRDPYRGEWVIMAPGRAARPQPADSPPLLDAKEAGPFAAGNESMTPREVFALRPPGGKSNDSSWRVRAFPNLYPALRVEDAALGTPEGPSDRMGGLGAHEVIVEDPDRTADLSTLEASRVFEVLCAWRARLADLRRDGRLACGVLFKNRGGAAGATVLHPHSQLLALPFIPPSFTAELDAVARYRAAHGRCPLCDVLRHERALGERLVVEGPGACVVAPFASRVPYELVAAPLQHRPALEDTEDAVLHEVAGVLREGLRRLDAKLGKPAYHLWLRTAPWRGRDSVELGTFHWHITVAPVTSRVGAFEGGAGLRINTVLPEEAAATLRER